MVDRCMDYLVMVLDFSGNALIFWSKYGLFDRTKSHLRPFFFCVAVGERFGFFVWRPRKQHFLMEVSKTKPTNGGGDYDCGATSPCRYATYFVRHIFSLFRFDCETRWTDILLETLQNGWRRGLFQTILHNSYWTVVRFLKTV